ncbi:MAG TPA: dTDP-4-dehydrorhamnose reductase [Bacteroidetes bacterium]|nr:dTDP-4-dehydrorhamnose reductase [Bacteroidota bacterium]HCN36605.1 dTDP-4-dehydrorhamnose reductase [Bacteroidota bacterium]
MRIFVTGANGLLGQTITSIFTRESDFELITSGVETDSSSDLGHTYERLDLTNKDEVKKLIGFYEPDVIVNCAAFTDVDKCETERELCWKVNVDAVKHLIIASRINNAKIIHYSTDYIFDGKNGPYDEEAKPNPVSFYGRSKLASENALLTSGADFAIARTMVLFGIGNNIKPNFALWLIGKLKNNEPVNIVDDQIGNVTISDDLAFGTLKIIELKKKGVFNIAGSDILSRYEFVLKMCEVFGFNKNLVSKIKTADLNQPAPRPLNSGLITLKAQSELGFKPMDSLEALRLLKIQLGY